MSGGGGWLWSAGHKAKPVFQFFVSVTPQDTFNEILGSFLTLFVDVRPSPAMFVLTKGGILSQKMWSFLNPNQEVLMPKPNQSRTREIENWT